MFIDNDELLLSFLRRVIKQQSCDSLQIWEALLECQIRQEVRLMDCSASPNKFQVSEVIRLLRSPDVSILPAKYCPFGSPAYVPFVTSIIVSSFRPITI